MKTDVKMPEDANGNRKVGTLENAIHARSPTKPDYMYLIALGQMTLISRGHLIDWWPNHRFYTCGECTPRGRGAR